MSKEINMILDDEVVTPATPADDTHTEEAAPEMPAADEATEATEEHAA